MRAGAGKTTEKNIMFLDDLKKAKSLLDEAKPKNHVDMILITENVIVSGNSMLRIKHKGKFYMIISQAMFENIKKESRGYKNDPVKNPVFLGIQIEINEDLVDEVLSSFLLRQMGK